MERTTRTSNRTPQRKHTLKSIEGRASSRVANELEKIMEERMNEKLLKAIDRLLADVRHVPPVELAEWLQNAILETEREIFDRLLRCRVFITENPNDERNAALVADMVAYHRAARERIGLHQETSCSLTGLCRSRPAMDLTIAMIQLDMRMDSIRKAHPEFTFA